MIRWCNAALAAVGLLLISASPSASAEQLAAPPRLSAWVHSGQVLLSAPAGSRVYVQLHGALGLKASGAAVVGRNGMAIVALVDDESTPNPSIEPGDRLVVQQDELAAVNIDVPELAVDADAATDNIFGVGPAGSELAIVLGKDNALGTALTGPDGSFTYLVDGTHDLDVGDYGHVRYESPAGDEFLAQFVVFSASFSIGLKALTVSASPGSNIDALIVSPNGSRAAKSVMVKSTIITPEPRALQLDGIPPLVASTMIELTRRSPVGGRGEVRTIYVPDLAVKLNAEQHVLTGRAPAGADLEIEAGRVFLSGAFTPSFSTRLTAQADGSFRTEMPTTLAPGPGWRATITYRAADGWIITDADTLVVFQTTWRGVELRGLINPSTSITLTVLDDMGIEKAHATTTSTNLGRFSVYFGSISDSPSTIRLNPHDRIQVDIERTGDPRTFDIPQLSIETNAAADRMAGTAPAGCQVEITLGSGQTISRWADGTGHYSVDVGEYTNIRPGDSGPITFVTESGIEFVTGWSAPLINVNLMYYYSDEGFTSFVQVDGNGIPGRTITMQLLDDAGHRVASGTADTLASRITAEWVRYAIGWSAYLTDITGDPPTVELGDRLMVTIGDDTVDIAMPPLEAVVRLDSDEVSGLTRANSAIVCKVLRQGVAESSEPVQTQSNRDGRFTCDFSGNFDIQYNDDVYVSLTLPEGHTIVRRVRTKGLTVDLAESTVAGVEAPTSDLVITLRNGTAVRASRRITTNGDGAFTATFVDNRSKPIDLVAGDEITVEPANGPGTRLVSLILPQLTVDIQRSSMEVYGHALPGSDLTMNASSTYYFQGSDAVGSHGYAQPAIRADGQYRANATTFINPIDLRPGTWMEATMRMPVGHLILNRQVVPLVNAPHGGSVVCGVGPANIPVTASLVDARGVKIASTNGQTQHDGRFQLTLHDALGEDVVTRAGDSVQVEVAGIPIAVQLPELVLNLVWNQRDPLQGQPFATVTGQGPSLTQYYIDVPANECFTGFTKMIEYYGRSDMHGYFARRIDGVAAGDGLQVAMNTPEWYRFYWQYTRPKVHVFVNTNRVTGQVTPRTRVKLRLSDEAGKALSEVSITSNSRGLFEGRFVDLAGNEIRIPPGGTLRVELDEESFDISVEDLWFDFSASQGLAGKGTIGRVLHGQFGLRDGRLATIDLVGDRDGNFRFNSLDVPARATWSLSDVTSIRIAMDVTGGHDMVTEANISVGPPVNYEIFLPWTGTTQVGRSQP